MCVYICECMYKYICIYYIRVYVCLCNFKCVYMSVYRDMPLPYVSKTQRHWL